MRWSATRPLLETEMSSYINPIDYLTFPSGRTVRDARKEAKRRQKETGEPYTTCLNNVASQHGMNASWDSSMTLLLDNAIEDAMQPRAPMTVDELWKVAKRNPRITQYGIGMWRDFEILRPWISFQDQLREERDTIYELLPQVNNALAFINHLIPQKAINDERLATSYEFKHIIEIMLRALDVYCYIPHGAFIIAALHKGFLPKECGPGSLSLYFNISPDSPILKWDGNPDVDFARTLKRDIIRLNPTSKF